MNTTLFTQKSINKPTLKRTLLMSMIAMSMGGMGVSAQAQTAQNSQQEIEQLRQEVQALRALVEQQQKQTATLNTAVQTQQAAAASAKPVMKLASFTEMSVPMPLIRLKAVHLHVCITRLILFHLKV